MVGSCGAIGTMMGVCLVTACIIIDTSDVVLAWSDSSVIGVAVIRDSIVMGFVTVNGHSVAVGALEALVAVDEVVLAVLVADFVILVLVDVSVVIVSVGSKSLVVAYSVV